MARIRPFQPGEYITNPDGSYSTERTVTVQDRGGKWVNVPSLWKDANGKTMDFGDNEDAISNALGLYEQQGPSFKRFDTVDDAVTFAKKRSSEGGAFSGTNLPQPETARSTNNMFNVMDLFGPGALNRLLQPAQQQGVQNFLANPGAVQPGFFNEDRFGGGQGQTNRAPAVGIEALVERLAPQMQANASGQASAGAGQAVQGNAGMDPWLGMRESDVVAPDQWANMRQPSVDPMQTGGVGQAQPVGRVAVPDKPGGWDKYTKDIFRENLNQFFVGMAQGRTPAESLSMGAMAANAKHNDMKNANQTVAWLQSKGMDKEQAWAVAQNPTVLSEYLKTLVAGKDPMKALQLEKLQLENENLRNPTAKLTDDQREYQAAKEQGFQGSFMDYQVKMKEAGRSQVNIDTGAKLPSGYRWLDPKNQDLGVEPIPGGNATQLPGELAARIGMADNFLKNDLPVVRQSIKDGNVTGVIDRFSAANRASGKPAEAYRKIQSGVEVLSRLLSGAGMTQVEIDEKAARYMPSYTDTPESLALKMDQLEAELTATKNAALRGRGGPQQSQQAQPQAGVVDYQEYFKGP